MVNMDRARVVAAKTPKYPGRKAVERVALPLAKRLVISTVERLMGYWQLRQFWSRSEIVDRGYMGRSTAFQSERDFEAMFGVAVEDATLSTFRQFFEAE